MVLPIICWCLCVQLWSDFARVKNDIAPLCEVLKVFKNTFVRIWHMELEQRILSIWILNIKGRLYTWLLVLETFSINTIALNSEENRNVGWFSSIHSLFLGSSTFLITEMSHVYSHDLYLILVICSSPLCLFLLLILDCVCVCTVNDTAFLLATFLLFYIFASSAFFASYSQPNLCTRAIIFQSNSSNKSSANTQFSTVGHSTFPLLWG